MRLVMVVLKVLMKPAVFRPRMGLGVEVLMRSRQVMMETLMRTAAHTKRQQSGQRKAK